MYTYYVNPQTWGHEHDLVCLYIIKFSSHFHNANYHLLSTENAQDQYLGTYRILDTNLNHTSYTQSSLKPKLANRAEDSIDVAMHQ